MNPFSYFPVSKRNIGENRGDDLRQSCVTLESQTWFRLAGTHTAPGRPLAVLSLTAEDSAFLGKAVNQ